MSFEVGDIAVDGEPIRYGSQMLPTIQVALFPRAVAADTPQAPQPLVDSVALAWLPARRVIRSATRKRTRKPWRLVSRLTWMNRG